MHATQRARAPSGVRPRTLHTPARNSILRRTRAPNCDPLVSFWLPFVLSLCVPVCVCLGNSLMHLLFAVVLAMSRDAMTLFARRFMRVKYAYEFSDNTFFPNRFVHAASGRPHVG